MQELIDLVPQLRVVLTTVCGKRCKYCRPSGEAALRVAAEETLPVDRLIECIRCLAVGGIREVRLTGGDPAFYPHKKLSYLVGALSKMRLDRVSLVTRSHLIREVLPDLKNAGLQHITFSLDSLSADRWVDICGIGADRKIEHMRLLETIQEAKSLGFNVNINSVLLRETCRQDLEAIVSFAMVIGIGVKIEEIIRDIGENGGGNESLYVDLRPLKEELRKRANYAETVFVQGGLGHPMEVLHFEGGSYVAWKMLSSGACYGPSCKNCKHYPCDDALMALRLLPNGRLQSCLKRGDNLVDFAKDIKAGPPMSVVDRVLSEYRNAKRMSYEEILSLRNNVGSKGGE